MQHRASRMVLALLLSGCALRTGNAQIASADRPAIAADAKPMTAAEIVSRMLEHNRERAAALEHYSSERTYTIEYHGTGGEHRAAMVVHAEYTGPEHKQLTVVSESGSKFICEKVLHKLVEGEQEAQDRANRMQTSLGPENYTAELIGEETASWPGVEAGTRAWVLRVTPKVDNKFTYKGLIWISQDDYAVMRVEGEPAKSPSWWINRATLDSRYVRRGIFWLPGRNVSTSHVRIGGEATLTIDYGNYPVVVARGNAGSQPLQASLSLGSPASRNANVKASSPQK